MHPATKEFIRELEDEAERCEAIADGLAKTHEAGFAPRIDWSRKKASDAHELIERLKTDSEFQ